MNQTLMPLHRLSYFKLAVLIIAQPTLLSAQGTSVPERRLAKADVELREPFTSITSVRELSDGRVIIVDNRETLVQLADLRTQQLTKIGREGAGPGEYGSARRLYALANDVTLLDDFVNNRYLVIGADGKPTATRPIDNGPYPDATGLVGIDAIGRSYLSVRPPGSREEGGVQAIVRYDPRTKKVDTLTTITLPTGRFSGASQVGGGMLKLFTNKPLAPEDVVTVSQDGSVAVVRVDDYHVEWFHADGRRVKGGQVDYTPIRIDAAEKRAFLERQVRPGGIVVRRPGGDGQKGGAVARKAGEMPKVATSKEALDDTGMDWPSRKPPFPPNAASVDRQGRLWVRRSSTHDDKSARYDLFDVNGKLLMRVVLPPGTSLVGFGRNTVYLSREDDDELRYLQRYAAP